MSADRLTSTLKLDYHRERFTYNIDWGIPFEVGAEHHNFLMGCSKLTKRKIFRSEKISCTSGPFQGAGKYFQFCIRVNVKPEVVQADLFAIIRYEINDQDEDRQSYQFLNVNLHIYDRGSTETKRNEQPLSFLILDDSRIPKLENSHICGSYKIPSFEKVTRFSFCVEVEVLFERWRKPSSSTDEHLDIPVSDVSEISGQLILNTNDLLFSPNWSDVTIYCGDREFPAHVLILQNKSSVLRAMFYQSMVENLTRKLTIEDAEPEVVEEFLRYIYTGKVTDMAKNSDGLIVMAEKYDVQNLKSLCENFILDNISTENVLERYNLGKLLNSNAITSKCIQEIKKNRKTIWKTEDEFCEACQKFPKLFYELFYNF